MPVPGKPHLKMIKKPRIALYKSFVPSIDEGWTRWLLEKSGFEFQSLTNSDISGSLGQFDVLIVPDESAATLTEGYRPGQMPPTWVGGLDDWGPLRMKQFAESGGTIVFLNRSADWAIDRLGLKVKNVVRGLPSREYYSPGSILNSTLDLKSPLSAGLPRGDFDLVGREPGVRRPRGRGSRGCSVSRERYSRLGLAVGS